MKHSTKISGSLAGLGVENIPSPSEKSKVNTSGVSNSGTGKGAGVSKASPLTASYDSRPGCCDNKPGATRSK